MLPIPELYLWTWSTSLELISLALGGGLIPVSALRNNLTWTLKIKYSKEKSSIKTDNSFTNKFSVFLISKVLACFGKGAGRKEMKKQKLQRFGTRNLESGICFSMTSEIDDSFLSSTLFLLT